MGDTPYDAQAAAKAGIRAIGLLCGGWSGEDLKRSGCIAIYKDPADLLALYGVSPLAWTVDAQRNLQVTTMLNIEDNQPAAPLRGSVPRS